MFRNCSACLLWHIGHSLPTPALEQLISILFASHFIVTPTNHSPQKSEENLTSFSRQEP